MNVRVESRAPASVSVSFGLVVVAFVVLASTVVVDSMVPLVAASALVAAACLSLVPAGRIDWRLCIAGILLVILFIPIRRYTFPVELPFEVEPYRVLVALVLGGWFVSLLVDRTVKIRRSILDGPLALVAFAIAASILANPARAAGLQADVLKSVTFFASFLLVFYLVASVVRSRRDVDLLVKIMLVGGAIVAALAVVEFRTGFNIYDEVMGKLPFLTFHVETIELTRSTGVRRAFGSAEHPIALGALLAMLIPLAVYAARTTGRRLWWATVVLLGLGLLATVSRTSVLMVGAAGLVIFIIRPAEIRRLLPLALVALVLAKAVVPGSVGTLRYFFFPEGGLIAQQTSSAGSCTSAGRIADLGPAFDEVSRRPALGYGFGTRIPTGERANACILDNQWLATLLEIGVVGLLAFVWLFSRFVRRLAREARRDPSLDGWLPTALASSVTAYAVGMLTYDAFSFVQVTFLMFILLGLGAAFVADRAPRAV